MLVHHKVHARTESPEKTQAAERGRNDSAEAIGATGSPAHSFHGFEVGKGVGLEQPRWWATIAIILEDVPCGSWPA